MEKNISLSSSLSSTSSHRSFMEKTEMSFESETNLSPPLISDTYEMSHKNRGVAVIFNQVNFDTSLNVETRDGSNKDCDDLLNMFDKLQFNVLVFNDLTVDGVKNALSTVSKMDHSESDCLVLVVMSHGNSDEEVYAQNGKYPTFILWESFSATCCPSLTGKPKLFFMQACRGNRWYETVKVKSSDGIDMNKSKLPCYSIPAMADFLIMYSTMDGYISFRDDKKGSYFIQSLVKQIKFHHETKDLLTILTFVNRDVAIIYPSAESKEKQKPAQMPSILSMLTKQMFFKKKKLSQK